MKNNKIKVILQNVNNNVNLTSELIEIIWSSKNVIIIVIEYNEGVLLNKFSPLVMAVDGRTLVLVSSNLEWTRLDTNGLETVPIKIKSLNLIVIAVYINTKWRTNSGRMKLMATIKLIEELLLNNDLCNFMIGGDWNMELDIWSDNKNQRNLRDLKLKENITKVLSSLNPITRNLYTYTNSRQQKSMIDMILIKGVKLLGWDKQINNSDHIRLITSVSIETITNLNDGNNSTKKLVIGSWYLGWDFNYDAEQLGKNGALVKLSKAILHFPDNHGLWCYSKNTKKPNRLERLIKRRNYLRRAKHKNEFDLRFINMRIRLLLKRSRLYQIINNTTTPKQLWKIYNKHIRNREQIDWTNQSTLNSRNNWLKDFSTNKPIYKDQTAMVVGKLHPWEEERIRKMKFRTSSLCADNFTNWTWTKFFETNMEVIINCVKGIFSISVVPNILNTLGCGFVPKKNTLELRMVKSSSYLMKIIGDVINQRLLDILPNWLLPDTQFGFGRNSSREFFFLTVTEKWSSKTIVKLDIEKAFDNIKLEQTIRRLSTFLDESTINLINSMRSNRWLAYWNSQEKKKYYKKETSDLSQGQPYSPVLFAMTLDFPIRTLRSLNVSIYAYADDLVILCDKEKEDLTMLLVSSELNKIGLKINHAKTERYHDNATTMFKLLGFYYCRKPTYKMIITKMHETLPDTLLSIGRLWARIYKLPQKLRRIIISQIILPKLYNFSPLLLCQGRIKAVDTIGKILNKACFNNETKWAWLKLHNFPNILSQFEMFKLTKTRIEKEPWKYKDTPIRHIQKLLINDHKSTDIHYYINGTRILIIEETKVWECDYDKTKYKSREQRECLVIYNIIERTNKRLCLSEYASIRLWKPTNFSRELLNLLWQYKRFFLLYEKEKMIPDTQSLRWPLTDYTATWCCKNLDKTILDDLYNKAFKLSTSPLINFCWKKSLTKNPRAVYLLSRLTKIKTVRKCGCDVDGTILHHLFCYTNLPAESIYEPERWTKDDIKLINDLILYFSNLN